MLTASAHGTVVTDAGVPFFPPRQASDRDYNRLAATNPALSRLPNAEVLARLFAERAVHDAPAQAHDVGTVAAEWQPDLLVNDGIALGVPLAAGLFGLPWATVSPFLFCTIPAPELPPAFLGMPYRPGPIGRSQALVAHQLAELRLAAASHRWRALARAWHVVNPPASVRLAGISPLAYIWPGGAPLEYPHRQPATQAHGVGPLVYEDGDSPPPASSSRSRIFVTEGTTHTDRRLARLAVRTFAGQPFEVLIVARRWPTSQVEGLAANVHVVPYIRYSAALAGAALLVTNGGAGSLIAALSAAVPALILPAGLDKAEAAERMAWAGAGLRLPAADRCSLGEFRAAATTLLREPRYRERAATVGKELLALGGSERAATLLEEGIGARPANERIGRG